MARHTLSSARASQGRGCASPQLPSLAHSLSPLCSQTCLCWRSDQTKVKVKDKSLLRVLPQSGLTVGTSPPIQTLCSAPSCAVAPVCPSLCWLSLTSPVHLSVPFLGHLCCPGALGSLHCSVPAFHLSLPPAGALGLLHVHLLEASVVGQGESVGLNECPDRPRSAPPRSWTPRSCPPCFPSTPGRQFCWNVSEGMGPFPKWCRASPSGCSSWPRRAETTCAWSHALARVPPAPASFPECAFLDRHRTELCVQCQLAQ